MATGNSMYGPDPDFGHKLEYHIQQERPDGSLWSVTFWLNGLEPTASKRLFATEAEAREYAVEQCR